MLWESLLSSIVYGILVGGVYALISMGLALIWGVMDVINLSHGELVLLGGYVAYWLFVLEDLNPLLSLPLAALVVGSIGLIMEKFFVSKIKEAPALNTFLLTYGIGIFIANAILQIWTADYRRVNVSFFLETVSLGPIRVSRGDVLTFSLSFGLIMFTHIILTKTYLGKAIRALTEDRIAAQLMGINDKQVDIIAFVMGSMLAGAAGSLFVSLYYVYPALGGWITAKAFIIVVLSGVGSMSGTILGGVMLGVAESIATTLISASYRELIGFVIFIITLLIKPSGLLGRSSH